MNDNLSGAANTPPNSFGRALRDARLAEIKTHAALEKLACEAVRQIVAMVKRAELLETPNGARPKPLYITPDYSLVALKVAKGRRYTLRINGYPVASETGLCDPQWRCEESGIDQLIVDLEAGLMDEVREFTQAAIASRNRDRHVPAPHPPHGASRRVVVMTHGLLVPMRRGWDYEEGKKLSDGTVVVPRGRALRCPPEIGFPCIESKTGVRVADIRLALAFRDNAWEGVFLNGDAILPDCAWEHAWGRACSDFPYMPELQNEAEVAMQVLEKWELDVEKSWAVAQGKAKNYRRSTDELTGSAKAVRPGAGFLPPRRLAFAR